jgi:hypothetical protein
VTLVVNWLTNASEMMRVGSLGNFPLHKKILMNLIMSSAVENKPECPATPPKK